MSNDGEDVKAATYRSPYVELRFIAELENFKRKDAEIIY
jgi:hypothetical protein